MKILQTINKVLDTAAQKNQKAAVLRQLRKYVKAHTAAMRYEYMRLGKYYYENLNLNGSGQADTLCRNIDGLREKVARAQQKISQVNNSAPLYREDASAASDVFSYEFEPDEDSAEPEPAPAHSESTLTYLWDSLQEADYAEESFDTDEAAQEPFRPEENPSAVEPEREEEYIPESAPVRREELYLINDSKEAADDEDGMIIPMPNLPPQ